MSTTESNARKKEMKNAKPNKTELTNSCVSILKRNSKKNGTMNKKERIFLSATSVKQSKKLLEAGYSADMADMAWVKPNTFITTYTLFEKEQTLNYPLESYEVVPAWSLLRLLQLLPSSLEVVVDEETMECKIWDVVVRKDNGISYVDSNDGECLFITQSNPMQLKNCLVETFLWLAKEQWHFKVEEEFDSLSNRF